MNTTALIHIETPYSHRVQRENNKQYYAIAFYVDDYFGKHRRQSKSYAMLAAPRALAMPTYKTHDIRPSSKRAARFCWPHIHARTKIASQIPAIQLVSRWFNEIALTLSIHIVFLYTYAHWSVCRDLPKLLYGCAIGDGAARCFAPCGFR